MNKIKLNAFFELTKPRITLMVLVTTLLGFYCAQRGIHDWGLLVYTLLGAGLTCAGAAVLNNYLDRDADALMLRTKNRSLPSGVLSSSEALSFGISLTLVGVIILCVKVNLLTAFLSLLTSFLYTLVYTPMKRISWFNTTIGAIPGAIPPMGGWAAARGELGIEAWILFAILFIWQHPHFFAIAWIFKDDYRKAGFKMLPVVDPDGKSTFQQTIWFSALLILISLLPSMIGMAGRVYFWGALIAGILLFQVGWQLRKSHSTADAYKLLKASVIYLPILLLLIVFDVTF